MTDEAIVLNETIHQSTRLRIMTMLVSMPETDRLAYGFIQKTLDLTGGNLTTHLRKLEDADYLTVAKEFQDSKPRTWVQATPAGRRAFAEYLSNLERALRTSGTGAEPEGRTLNERYGRGSYERAPFPFIHVSSTGQASQGWSGDRHCVRAS